MVKTNQIDILHRDIVVKWNEQWKSQIDDKYKQFSFRVTIKKSMIMMIINLIDRFDHQPI